MPAHLKQRWFLYTLQSKCIIYTWIFCTGTISDCTVYLSNLLHGARSATYFTEALLVSTASSLRAMLESGIETYFACTSAKDGRHPENESSPSHNQSVCGTQATRNMLLWCLTYERRYSAPALPPCKTWTIGPSSSKPTSPTLSAIFSFSNCLFNYWRVFLSKGYAEYLYRIFPSRVICNYSPMSFVDHVT